MSAVCPIVCCQGLLYGTDACYRILSHRSACLPLQAEESSEESSDEAAEEESSEESSPEESSEESSNEATEEESSEESSEVRAKRQRTMDGTSTCCGIIVASELVPGSVSVKGYCVLPGAALRQ